MNSGARPDRDPLQWGRDHVIAELGAMMAAAAVAVPLQWGRDHVIAELPTWGLSPCASGRFNGAAIT